MSTKHSCSNCAYFRKEIDPNNLTAENGQCTRNPPTAFPAQTQAGMGIMTIRPAVNPTDWCGEWKQELEKRDTRRSDIQ